MRLVTQPLPLVAKLRADMARGVGGLPVLPAAAIEALRLAQKPDMVFAEVVRETEVEPPLVARILARVNSPLYSRGVPIVSLQQALARMGVQATRDILYMAVYGSALFDTPRYRGRVRHIFDRGVLVGRTARSLAQHAGAYVLDPDLAFLSGLLHDVGRACCLKLLANYPERAPEAEVEEAVETLHAEAGAQLVVSFHLPREVAEVCLHHAAPTPGQPLSLLVHLAELLIDALTHADWHGKRSAAIDGAFAALEIPPEQLPLARRQAREDQATLRRGA